MFINTPKEAIKNKKTIPRAGAAQIIAFARDVNSIMVSSFNDFKSVDILLLEKTTLNQQVLVLCRVDLC